MARRWTRTTHGREGRETSRVKHEGGGGSIVQRSGGQDRTGVDFRKTVRNRKFRAQVMKNAKRGRKSAAALEMPSVSALTVVQRPMCPHDLTDEESEVWFAVVNRLPADWFPVETHPLLTQYCRSVIQARRVAELIERATSDLNLETNEPTLSVAGYDRLLKMQARCSASIAMLATKMRISQQATTNHRGNKKAVTPKKPWED